MHSKHSQSKVDVVLISTCCTPQGKTVAINALPASLLAFEINSAQIANRARLKLDLIASMS